MRQNEKLPYDSIDERVCSRREIVDLCNAAHPDGQPITQSEARKFNRNSANMDISEIFLNLFHLPHQTINFAR